MRAVGLSMYLAVLGYAVWQRWEYVSALRTECGSRRPAVPSQLREQRCAHLIIYSLSPAGRLQPGQRAARLRHRPGALQSLRRQGPSLHSTTAAAAAAASCAAAARPPAPARAGWLPARQHQPAKPLPNGCAQPGCSGRAASLGGCVHCAAGAGGRSRCIIERLGRWPASAPTAASTACSSTATPAAHH